MFKINDLIRYNGTLGKVNEVKIIKTPSFLKNFTLYLVEFEEKRSEWINEIYLTKVN
jgi:hypothetical protein